MLDTPIIREDTPLKPCFSVLQQHRIRFGLDQVALGVYFFVGRGQTHKYVLASNPSHSSAHRTLLILRRIEPFLFFGASNQRLSTEYHRSLQKPKGARTNRGGASGGLHLSLFAV